MAPELPDAVLVIIGQGRLENALKQQVQQLKLEQQVFFPGVIPEVVNYFKAFDSFVLSSDNEPFGMVLLEAIVADVPVIATDAGGAKEIIRDKQWLFDIGDVNALAQLMLKIYEQDDEQIKTINNQNKQHLKQNGLNLNMQEGKEAVAKLIQSEINIQLNVMKIILEASRLLDEISIFKKSQ